MSLSRRDFLYTTAATGALGLIRLHAQSPSEGRRIFLHGVASGDPLSDRVMLWTRVTAPETSQPEVSWELARDTAFKRVVAKGMVTTGASRDFTVKVDAGLLEPGSTYYYRFEALGEPSPIGRTRTLPAAGAQRVRLALVSCSNLPYGYFNVYRRIAERPDLDAVVHLGDYIYEYQNGRYGDGAPLGRVPEPDAEIVTLADYRTRHAQYKRDPDLQEVHRQHPFVVVWDDHELANNTWRDGAQNHNPETGEGEWPVRRAAAIQAYLEWMPIREDRATRRVRIYRSFAFGDLADLIMLDTRVVDRDVQAAARDAVSAIDDPVRTLLGAPQEQWLFAELTASGRAGVGWQLLGQQVMFAPGSLPGAPAASTDNWDGYRSSRARLLDAIEASRLRNVVVLTGDVHSSWAYDVPRDPWNAYDPVRGTGSLAVEIVTPAITSPTGFGTPEQAARRVEGLLRNRPHLKYVEGTHRGYVVLDVTRERVQADWFFVPTIAERSAAEQFDRGFFTSVGESRLQPATAPAPSMSSAPAPAPHGVRS
jgi:alkaline phosphatase D